MKFKKILAGLLAAAMSITSLSASLTVQAENIRESDISQNVSEDISLPQNKPLVNASSDDVVDYNDNSTGLPTLSTPVVKNPTYFSTASGNLVYGEEGTVTKAEWLHNLALVFNMSVEEDNYPDNYFADLSSDNEYYYDILLTVEFGVIHIEAGENLYPDEPVSRLFAAQTLNYCLGFELDEDVEYTFSESTDSDYVSTLTDFQVAVNRGWFDLIGGAFMPDVYVTPEETELMLNDAAEIIASDIIDGSKESVYKFADYVIEFSRQTKAEIDENGTVTIYDAEKNVSVGDTFVIYLLANPLIFVAETVKVDDGRTTITTSPADMSAIIEASGSHVYNIDLVNFEPAEGVTATYIENEEQASSMIMPLGITPIPDSISLSKKVQLADGVSASVYGSISNITLYDDIGLTHTTIYITGNTELGAELDVDFVKAAGGKKSVTLGKFVYGFGLFTAELVAEIDLTGKVVAVYQGNFKLGASVDWNGFRTIKDFYRKSFSVCAELEADIGLTAK